MYEASHTRYSQGMSAQSSGELISRDALLCEIFADPFLEKEHEEIRSHFDVPRCHIYGQGSLLEGNGGGTCGDDDVAAAGNWPEICETTPARHVVIYQQPFRVCDEMSTFVNFNTF